jgi:peptidoglycan/xylan/chitin deacetylase (PgdA/CDA1 family)
MKIKKKGFTIRNLGQLVLAFLIGASAFCGCIIQSETLKTEMFENTATEDILRSDLKMNEFVLVRPGKFDTFESLADYYLGDADKGWLIAKFNRQNQVVPGKPLIVPLKSICLGGLTEDSYQTVPILVYHQFSNDYSGKLTVQTEKFYEQMLYLKENGYKVIKLDQLLDFMEFKKPLPDKSIVITIDDGWLSTYEIAYPILKKFGFPATLFIYTDLIERDRAMSWKQIKEMVENGFDVQSHTHSYQSLTLIKENESFKTYFEFLVQDIKDSKKAIKNHLNLDCRYIAYPYGETNPLVISLVKKLGYRAAFTLNQGSTPFFVNPYTIGRSIIYGDSDMNEFIKKISYTEMITLK